TLPIRIDVDDSLTFREHLRKVRQIMLDAFANKTVPFDLLVKELRPRVSGSENPFFQTMLVIHQDGIGNLSFDNVKAEALHIDSEVAKFDLTLFLKEGESDSVAMAEYDRRLFSQDMIESFLNSWAELLANIEKNPDTKVKDFNYLPSVAQNQLLAMGTGSGIDIGSKPIHELISQMAIDKPEEIAVCYGKEALSYQQLVRLANGLAHRLVKMGEQKRVGIYLERSTEFPTAILGILKSGAAYVPLDPEYPAERVQYILDDAQIDTVITNSNLKHKLDCPSSQILLIEDVKEAAETPNISVSLDDDVYLIYTSGSTGKPKGVQITHRNLLHSTLARRTFYPKKPTSYLMLSSFSFDSSIAGIFWSLLEGGTLYIPEKERYMEPDYLTNYIQEYSITHLLAIPSFYQQLLSYDASRLASLNTVIVAGEALRPALIDEHYKTLPNCLMVNEYGPTEATVWASAAIVSKEPRNSIGKAVGGTKLYVLNENGTLTLPGIPGELY
ncbi:MAG: AMP-binding protein, partial [Calditrichota bacterium]